MSKGNAIFYRLIAGRWHVREGALSCDRPNDWYLTEESFKTGGLADCLVHAHSMNREFETEYGIRHDPRDSQSPQLKLFVWNKFAPDYSDGLAFAIAGTEEEARAMVKGDGEPHEWGPMQEFPLSKKTSFACYGGG